MPFLNMRNHKKLLIVDGTVGFTGGLNIGADHSRQRAPKDYVDGVQVRVEGSGYSAAHGHLCARLVVYNG